MLGLREDFLYALRQLARHRFQAGLVVLILSRGFGPNTAVVHGGAPVTLRPLPVPVP